MERYNIKQVEEKWQTNWLNKKTDSAKFVFNKKNFYKFKKKFNFMTRSILL